MGKIFFASTLLCAGSVIANNNLFAENSCYQTGNTTIPFFLSDLLLPLLKEQ
jgi:hypothetical protein